MSLSLRNAAAGVFLLLVSCCFASSLDELVSSVQREIDRSPNNQAQWGLMAMDLETGEEILSQEQDKLFMPASNRKLFSTAFALDALGSDYQFSTRFEFSGSLDFDGTLAGDLIVRASGDPTISGIFRKDQSATGVFEEWAEALKAKGINRVTGNLVVDLSCFSESTKLGEGWTWDNESNAFSAPVGAFSFNENVVFVKVAPSATGSSCKVSLVPDVDGF